MLKKIFSPRGKKHLDRAERVGSDRSGLLAAEYEESRQINHNATPSFDNDTSGMNTMHLNHDIPPGDVSHNSPEKNASTVLTSTETQAPTELSPLLFNDTESPLMAKESKQYVDTNDNRLVSFAPEIDDEEFPHSSTASEKFNDDDDLSYDYDADDNQFIFSDDMLDRLRCNESIFYNERVKVRYQDRDHFGILTQMYGSVWKKVFPFCIFNVGWCYAINYLKVYDIVNLDIPASGHSFMSILVAFLTVARVQITYARFMEGRGYLGGCFKSIRELIQFVSVMTTSSTNTAAKEWRESVAISCIGTLRATVAAVEFSTAGQCPYESVPIACLPPDASKVKDFLSRQAHYQRTRIDEALRAPLVFASSLRKVLLQPKVSKCLNTPLDAGENLMLLSYVTNFCSSYQGLTKLITTPFSFPLVQMSRTILFFWVFTLPMALMNDPQECMQIAIIVFFVTYGFIGLEYVSIELDDPFGDDPNDFNTLGMAQGVYEDVYLTLYQTDGFETAENFRRKVSSKKKTYNGSDKNV